MLKFRRLIVTLALIGSASIAHAGPPGASINLSGEWRFRLDPQKAGLEGKWFDTVLPERTRLPGSTDENGFGTRNDARALDKLSRPSIYTGPAWYQRDVEIPAGWSGRRVTLFLERCHWETQAWLDDKPLGMRDSLCVPHVYDLGATTSPGHHRLTIRVDNTVKFNVGNWAHCITEETQTNWNGIVGTIELRAGPPVQIDDVQVYPDIENKRARVKVRVNNATGKPAKSSITLTAKLRGETATASRAIPDFMADQLQPVEADLSLESVFHTWDESSPALYDLTVDLQSTVDGSAHADRRTLVFGMRQLAAKDKQILLNHRPLFIRGTLECCIFPLTGYPPTDTAAWARIIGIAKSYGLNHLRFHSWCPPEAAFAAADEAGFTFHVEAPQWVFDVGADQPRDAFIRDEVMRILDTYGNHASFGVFCLGNELKGDEAVLYRLVKEAKAYDPRHLYASATAWVFGPDDDYAIPFRCRGIQGPGTDNDFRKIVAEYRVPCITHELGQWTVFPNLAEIAKYTGVLKPRNFETIRERLAANHLLEQAPAFTLATGRQMVLLYKEEIESQLRTPNSSGFQLLDLHDFPGQSTAIVGTLDAFWDSKGAVTPEAFRRFCGPTVPLLRMSKRVFRTDETFAADAELAHFGPADLRSAEFTWSISDDRGAFKTGGKFNRQDIPTGTRTALGRIEAPLANAVAPGKLVVTISLPGTPIGNDWDIWVYPSTETTATPADVLIATKWDDAARQTLSAGGKVLLLPGRSGMAKSLAGSFFPPFWTPLWNKHPLSMSILCDPRHPALARFPTEMHTNWQWYDLLQTSRSMILDDLPATLHPIVQVIDVFPRNHRLANLWEARVDRGRLVVCSLDLRTDLARRPVARQMRESILAYMSGEAFRPEQELPSASLDRLFREHSPAVLSQTMPSDTGQTMLRVKAGGKAPAGRSDWSPARDEVVTRDSGFDYRVEDSVAWRDSTGTSWASERLVVVVTCPKGFSGSLLVRMDDWNDQNRKADVVLNDWLVAGLDRYNLGGTWLRVPITSTDTSDGQLRLTAESTAGPNAMITELIVTN